MRSFMDYVQQAFYEASGWNVDNSYSSLTASAQSLVSFDTPRGLRINVSSLASHNFATSYTLGSIGLVDGSLSYLYSSLPIITRSKSSQIDLRRTVLGYRQLSELRDPVQGFAKALATARAGPHRKDTLLYGRLYLPESSLEALYLRRISPTRQLKISCVSDPKLSHGGALLALLQQDCGKYSTEYLYSTDSAMLGIRGLYNFGLDPRKQPNDSDASEQLQGRFSAGAELYYGLLNKSGGISTGLRFTTLPRYAGFPYTMTLTLNPLMGNLSSTYAVRAGRDLALCSQFDFNFYSYESDFRLGCEIWRRRRHDVEWAERLLRQGWTPTQNQVDDDVSGVLKARWDQTWKVGLLWEGRIKDLLFSLGLSCDLQRREQIFQAVGVELQYSS